MAALYEDFHELFSIMGKCERKEAAEAQAFVGMGWKPTPYVHIITISDRSHELEVSFYHIFEFWMGIYMPMLPICHECDIFHFFNLLN